MNKHKLTECEAQVLMLIYEEKEPPNLPEITEKVNKKYNKKWKPQTVSTMLTRLITKGYLTNKRSGRTFLYYPTYSLEEVQRAAVNNLVDIFFERKIIVLKDFMKDVEEYE